MAREIGTTKGGTGVTEFTPAPPPISVAPTTPESQKQVSEEWWKFIDAYNVGEAESEEAGPQITEAPWWSDPSAYPDTVEKKAEPAIGVPTIQEWTAQQEEEEPERKVSSFDRENEIVTEAAQAQASVWDNMMSWVETKAESIASMAVSAVQPIEAAPAKKLPEIFNYLWGNPWGEGDTGTVWSGIFNADILKTLVYVGFQLGSDIPRRVLGWTNEMGATVPRLASRPGLHASADLVKYNLLEQGKYVDAVRNEVVPVTETPEERTVEIQAAEEAQRNFNVLYEKLQNEGYSKPVAMRRAVAEIVKQEEITKVKGKPIFGGVSTPESPIPWSDYSRKAWEESAGFRYSHNLRPELDREYHELRAAGVDAKTAGDLTEDPIYEGVSEFFLDLNLALPIDNLIIGAGWKGVKATAGGAYKVGLKVPVIKSGLKWLGENTARTTANFVARYTSDALRIVRRYVGSEASPDDIVDFIKNPSRKFMTNETAYYKRAVAGAQPYADDILKQLKNTFSDKVVDEAKEKAAKDLINEGVKGASENDILYRAIDILWDDAMKKSSTEAYRASLETYLVEHPAYAKMMKKLKPVNSVVTGTNGILVDTWLGLRPAWNVYNYVDNVVKLLIEGINPFQSLPKMVERYALYSPELEQLSVNLDELKKIHFWNLSKGSSDKYVQLLQRAAPKQSLGTFATSMLEVGGKPSLVRRTPIIGKIADWNTALGGRIEMSMHARVYFKSFFDVVDKGWDEIVERVPEAVVNGQSVQLTPKVAEALRQRLHLFDGGPITDRVRRAIQGMLTEGRLDITVSKLGDDLAGGMNHIPQSVRTEVASELNGISRRAKTSGYPVFQVDIDRIFDNAANAIAKSYDDAIASGHRAFEDSIPKFPEVADDLYNALLPTGKAASLEDVFRAIDDMPAATKRVNLVWQETSNKEVTRIKRMLKEGRSLDVLDKEWTNFLEKFRNDVWTKYNQMQQEVAERLMNQADELMAAAGKTERYPREIMKEYLDAGRAKTESMLEKSEGWKKAWHYVRTEAQEKAARDIHLANTSKAADEMFTSTKVMTDDAIHQAMVKSRRWFVDNGLTISNREGLGAIGKNAGWWRTTQQIENIPESARKQVEPMLEQLKTWRKEVLSNRVRPYETIPLSAMDRQVLTTYGNRVVADTSSLISGATDAAVKASNDILFDYETTQNWMSVAGKIFPFVRFPSKNIPYWIEKFAEVPHFAGAIANIREIQADINKDLPARLRYTVKIPRVLTDWLMEALGFHNVELRVNPWSYLSVFQQMPGATTYSQQRLAELSLDDGDEIARQRLKVFATVSDELGFGMWPYLEWAFGAMGWLGEDWYPRSVVGGYVPVVNYVLREVFNGYDKSFDIDRHMRSTLPFVWNRVFGKGPLAWESLNPDLFEEWAMGREIEGIIDKMPDQAVAQLLTLTPAQARTIASGLTEEESARISNSVLPVFNLPAQEQIARVQAFSPEEMSVFLLEMENIGLRQAVKKQAFTALLGNTTGLYAQVTEEAEVAQHQLRIERRIAQELLPPGEERRDYISQWDIDHPKRQMAYIWRFSEHPWAETAAGREAEIWDSAVDQYKSRYYDYNDEFYNNLDKAVEETYRKYPGDPQRLKLLKDDYYKQRDEYIVMLNKELSEDITRRMEAFIEKYPTDKASIKKLKEGWETNVYVPVRLNEQERAELERFKAAAPQDEEGYETLFEKLYAQAAERNPTTQTRHVPGLNEGIQMNLEWSPANSANYSEEEVQRWMQGRVLDTLRDKEPAQEDYEDYDSYEGARDAYRDNLQEEALKLPEVQGQINTLVREQGMSEEDAKEIVRGWYTKEELYAHWRENDSIWEALESVYRDHVVSEADERLFNEIIPLKETDYELYALMREQLEMDYPRMPARDLVKYIMQDYPGRWTLAELDNTIGDLEMPSYDERSVLRETGEDAVNSHIWYFYNGLDSDNRKLVREALGPLFSDQFLTGEEESITIEMRGAWMDALAKMVGSEATWKTLPGIDESVLKSSRKEAHIEGGLPLVGPQDKEEFEAAQKLNIQYWELKAAGDPAAQTIEDNPLFKKWFGSSSAKSYFWNAYYTMLPPGKFSAGVRDNTLVKYVVDKNVSRPVALNSDYDRATDVILAWVEENREKMIDLGLDPKEFDAVRKLQDAYYDIPAEQKDARKAFLRDNPILLKYWNAGEDTSKTTTTGRRGGGGGGRGSGRTASKTAYSKETWTTFTARVGQSLSAVLRMLVYYWENKTLPARAEAYLRKLYAELGVKESFEDWLEALRLGYAALGAGTATSGSTARVKVGSVPKAPKPSYYTGTRGIRR